MLASVEEGGGLNPKPLHQKPLGKLSGQRLFYSFLKERGGSKEILGTRVTWKLKKGSVKCLGFRMLDSRAQVLGLRV